MQATPGMQGPLQMESGKSESSKLNAPVGLDAKPADPVATPQPVIESNAGLALDPNQLLAFKKVFIEPVKDNVDGAYVPTVDQVYREIFARNPRFEIVTSAAGADAAVVTSLTRSSMGTTIEIALQLVPTHENFATDQTTISAQASGTELAAAVKALIKTSLRRIPFYGTVTGRDNNEVTLDIGSAHGLKKGDIVQISRSDQIKRHPLLKNIVDVQMFPVGSVAVDSVEETIAFGHIHSEIAGEKIQRLHKVTAIEARAPDPEKDEQKEKDRYGAVSVDKTFEEIDDPNRPKLGYVGIGGLLGSFSSSTSITNTSKTYSGSAFAPGVKLMGELWFTKNWFVDAEFGYATFSLIHTDQSQSQIDPLTKYSSSYRSIGFNGGFRYTPAGTIYGPWAYFKLGYRNFLFDTTNDATVYQSPKSYSGLNLGIGGQLPFASRQVGALLGFNVMLFPGLTENGNKTDTGPTSITAISFNLGGYYHLSPQVTFRAGLVFDVFSTNFGESTTVASTSQKVFSIVPALLYNF